MSKKAAAPKEAPIADKLNAGDVCWVLWGGKYWPSRVRDVIMSRFVYKFGVLHVVSCFWRLAHSCPQGDFLSIIFQFASKYSF
jgi:hypothetical protein